MVIKVTGQTRVDGSTPGPPGPTFTAFTIGSVKPLGSLDGGTRNVGPRMDDTALTPYYGNYSLSSNTTVTGLDIYGQVTCSAGTTNAVMRDCVIRGNAGATSQDACAVGPSYNFRGTLFEWCRFDATGYESLWKDCLDGGNYTVRYSELLRGVDGMGANLYGYGVMEGCRIYHGHYGSYWDDAAGAIRTATFTDYAGATVTAPFPVHSSGDTHCDGAQIQGYPGWQIRGCNIGGARAVSSNSQLDPTILADYNIQQSLDADASFANSAIIVNAVSANPVGALIEMNWFNGGMAQVNMSINGSDTLGGVTLRNNRFGRTAGYALYLQNGSTATISGNVYDNDSTPVTATRWG